MKNDYKEISPPLIATDNTMFGTGQLPKFENDQFEIKLDDSTDRKFLIPTAEVILTNIVKNKILKKKIYLCVWLHQRHVLEKKLEVMARIQRA